MKIAVLGGGGAMGGLFGAHLAEAGHDVCLIDVSREAVAAINAHGLTLEDKASGTTRTVPVPASSDPATIGRVDAVLNFVKCYHTEDAVRAALPMLGDQTVVMTLQNGWGNAPRIAALVGEARVLVGLTYHSATLLAPGRVLHAGNGVTYLGELDGALSPRLEALRQALADAGFEVQITQHVRDQIYAKLALNACTLPTSALLGLQAHQLVERPEMLSLMRALLTEVAAVAQAQGIALDEGERWEAITSLLRRAVGAKSSMLQDVERKRRTEIDVINGAIVEAGQRLGIATPYNDSMVWLIKSLEVVFGAAGCVRRGYGPPHAPGDIQGSTRHDTSP